MTRAEIEARLSRLLLPVDARGDGDGEGIPAAVLVALLDHGDRMGILLTQRTAHLPQHAGQVSFPGGRIDPGDSGPVAAALREAWEETGLDPSLVEVWGRMASYRTGTGYAVVPVVGLVTMPVDLRPEPGEVGAIFELPLDDLMDPAFHLRDERVVRGNVRRGAAIAHERYDIWGATAAMLMRLHDLLRAEEAEAQCASS